MCEVTSIERLCKPAIAGLICMYVIDVNDVVSIPAADDDWIIEDDIILKPSRFFKKIFFREQKAGLADELADAVGGGFKKNIGLFIPSYGNKSNKWVFKMIGTRFIMLIQDFNEQTILVGNLTSPMRMEKAMGNTGQKLGDENGWAVNIIAESNRPCYLYEGNIIDSVVIPEFFTAYWGWSPVPFDPATIENFNFQGGGEFDYNTAILADYTGAGDTYLALKYPSTEPIKTKWQNTFFNSGEIPDQIFNAVLTKGGFSYIYSRVVPALDATNKTISFT